MVLTQDFFFKMTFMTIIKKGAQWIIGRLNEYVRVTYLLKK